MAKKHKWTAREVIALLRDRYGQMGQGGSSNRYVFIEQVAPATGFTQKATWIDAMAISMWPSDGLHREAFEVKVSRSDFLKEINDPAKNLWFKHNCHMFWYVTGPGVVSAADEVPENCGWMLAQKNRLVIKKQATKNNAANTIDSEFFAAVARAMHKELDRQRRELRTAVLEEPMTKLALESTKAVDEWLKGQGVREGYGYPMWTDVEGLKKLLGNALAGEGDTRLTEAIQGRVEAFRDAVADHVLHLLPFAAELLSQAEGVGQFTSAHMGHPTYDMLADLRKKPSRYMHANRKQERKQKLKLIAELLGVAQTATERTMTDGGGEDE